MLLCYVVVIVLRVYVSTVAYVYGVVVLDMFLYGSDGMCYYVFGYVVFFCSVCHYVLLLVLV